jgi:GT2 family glycosyltransferase
MKAGATRDGSRIALARPGADAVPPRPVLRDIAVVIPTLGRPILERSLAALAAGTFWPDRLIVADQGDNPDVPVWLATLDAAGLRTLHVQCAGRGRALGVNHGIRAAETTFVCITDDDCLVDPDWLERMHAHLSAAPSTIVTGRIDGEGAGVLVVSPSAGPNVQRRPRLQFDCLSGGNMGMAVTLTRRIGMLDEDPRVRTAEDNEYAYRALSAGVPIAYVPDAGVCHLDWRSPREREAQYASYARSHGGFYGKYLRRGDVFIAARFAVHQLRATRRWLRGALRRDPDLAANGRAYALGLLPGILAGWRGTAPPAGPARPDGRPADARISDGSRSPIDERPPATRDP